MKLKYIYITAILLIVVFLRYHHSCQQNSLPETWEIEACRDENRVPLEYVFAGFKRSIPDLKASRFEIVHGQIKPVLTDMKLERAPHFEVRSELSSVFKRREATVPISRYSDHENQFKPVQESLKSDFRAMKKQ